jgi:hypothetical protein
VTTRTHGRAQALIWATVVKELVDSAELGIEGFHREPFLGEVGVRRSL